MQKINAAVRDKITAARNEPEQKRMRLISYATMLCLLIIGALWLFALLPAQIYFTRNNATYKAEESETKSTLVPELTDMLKTK